MGVVQVASAHEGRAGRIRPSLGRRLARTAPAAALVVALAACGGARNVALSPSSSSSTAASTGIGRYEPISSLALGPLYGSGCPENGACACGSARTLTDEFNCQLDHLAANDIPVTAYLFDGAGWSLGRSGADYACDGPSCCAWALGSQVVSRLAQQEVRGLLHYWGGCGTGDQFARAHSSLGRNLLGFYLDDGASDSTLQGASEFMESVSPGTWACVAKAYQNHTPSITNAGLRRWGNAAYVGDLASDYDGLKEAVSRVLAKAADVPAPFAELTGYDYQQDTIPSEEIYYRRLHFGALQPVMAHTPYSNCDPWRPEYGPGLLAAYRYYARLHKELVPYFYSYAYRMYETDAPVVRQGPTPFSMLVGDELFVPVVTSPGETMDVVLPDGSWIDLRDEARLVAGTLTREAVPLGREPIFVRQGALVPLDVERDVAGHGTVESAGALTVLVYPSGASSFRFRDESRGAWTTLASSLDGRRLTLSADPFPNRPLLFRIARWSSPPDTVAIEGTRVTVNGESGLAPVRSEAAANGSKESAWYYDASASRLIVKVVP